MNGTLSGVQQSGDGAVGLPYELHLVSDLALAVVRTDPLDAVLTADPSRIAFDAHDLSIGDVPRDALTVG